LSGADLGKARGGKKGDYPGEARGGKKGDYPPPISLSPSLSLNSHIP